MGSDKDAYPESPEEERALLQMELAGVQEDPGSMPPLLRALRECQLFLDSFEYSLAGPSFRTKKNRPLSEILQQAADIIRARSRVAIQCIEGAFVGLYLTQGLGGIKRFGISIESELPDGYRYYHQILGVAVCNADPSARRFGAFGLSRDFGLACKPAVFPTLVQLLRNFRVHYRRAGHEPLSCKLGRPIPGGPWRTPATRDPQFTTPPVWIQDDFCFGDAGWAGQVTRFERKLVAVPQPSWPESKCVPYRRDKKEGEEAQPGSPTMRPRAVPHEAADAPAQGSAEGRVTPPPDCVGKRCADATAPDDFTRRIRMGQFRHRCPGRLPLLAVWAHVSTVSAFWRTAAAQRDRAARRAERLLETAAAVALPCSPSTPSTAPRHADPLGFPESSPRTPPSEPASPAGASASLDVFLDALPEDAAVPAADALPDGWDAAAALEALADLGSPPEQPPPPEAAAAPQLPPPAVVDKDPPEAAAEGRPDPAAAAEAPPELRPGPSGTAELAAPPAAVPGTVELPAPSPRSPHHPGATEEDPLAELAPALPPAAPFQPAHSDPAPAPRPACGPPGAPPSGWAEHASPLPLPAPGGPPRPQLGPAACAGSGSPALAELTTPPRNGVPPPPPCPRPLSAARVDASTGMRRHPRVSVRQLGDALPPTTFDYDSDSSEQPRGCSGFGGAFWQLGRAVRRQRPRARVDLALSLPTEVVSVRVSTNARQASVSACGVRLGAASAPGEGAAGGAPLLAPRCNGAAPAAGPECSLLIPLSGGSRGEPFPCPLRLTFSPPPGGAALSVSAIEVVAAAHALPPPASAPRPALEASPAPAGVLLVPHSGAADADVFSNMSDAAPYPDPAEAEMLGPQRRRGSQLLDRLLRSCC